MIITETKLPQGGIIFSRTFTDVSGDRFAPFFYEPHFVNLENKLLKDSRYKRLRTAGKLFRGVIYSSSDEVVTGHKVIRANNIDLSTGELLLDDLVHVRPEISFSPSQKLRKGDILICAASGSKEHAGKACFIDEDMNAYFGGFMMVFRCDNRTINPEYLSYYMQSSLFRQTIFRHLGGTNINNISLSLLYGLRVIIPSEPVQLKVINSNRSARSHYRQRIKEASNLLAGVDSLLLDELGIKLKHEQPNNIKNRIYTSSFRKVTGKRLDPLFHLGDMFYFIRDANCELVSLGDLTSYFLTGFAAGRDDQGDKDGGIIQIRPTNINDDRELVFNRNVYIATSELIKLKSDLLKAGEVIFNNTNSQDQVGKTAYFDLKENYFSSNHITRIGPKGARLNSLYLYYLLNLYQRRKVFYKLCTNWNNQSGIGVDILKAIPIPLPDIKRQEQIVRLLEKVRTEANEIRRKAIFELEEVKRSIEALILGKGEQS